ncbi:MAG: hypothetical protein WA642_25030 [Steroidobacteraceae bacterium]
MEHRWGERVQVDFPVRLTAHRFSVSDGRLTDLSVSGALVEAELEARALSRVRVAIDLPLWPKHIAVGRSVCRAQEQVRNWPRVV